MLAFFVLKKLDKYLFLLLSIWCYGVIMERGDFFGIFFKKDKQ